MVLDTEAQHRRRDDMEVTLQINRNNWLSIRGKNEIALCPDTIPKLGWVG